MDNTKTDLLEKIKAANTALVTVSRNPSVDGLAACIGMALLLSKLKKHATAVFSGEIPSTIEFLKPEETLEKTPDSLRDFIISLDRNKADKLRYKVEDKVVKIFITPYRTSINEDDLEFSQGEFNVDLVITLGVQSNEDLDQAISSGGNVLHDATVVSISTSNSNIGSINWSVPQASSLCELVAELAASLGDAKLIDEQIATALLTGIVAETQRFSNDKTTSLTMSLSSQLMAAGANQKLVASQLSDNKTLVTDQDKPAPKDDGELDIHHGESDSDDTQTSNDSPLPMPADDGSSSASTSSTPDDNILPMTEDKTEPAPEDKPPADQPPALDVNPTGTPNDTPAPAEPSDQFSSMPPAPTPSSSSQATPAGFTPPPPTWVPPFDDSDLKSKVDAELSDPNATLANIEESVDSPHLKAAAVPPQEPPAATTPPPPPSPPSDLKNQLNQIIPQISPDMAATSPSASSVVNRVESDINPNDLKPPTDPKAPPYPPPLVPPAT